MKKGIIILIGLIVINANFTSAQKWGNYVQLSGGIGISVCGGYNGIFFQGEYGKTYKWLDLSLAMTYETYNDWDDYNATSDIFIRRGQAQAFPSNNVLQYRASNEFIIYDNNTSLSLNARIDIIRLFAENSRHSVKIGGGVGLAFEQTGESQRENLNQGEVYYLYISNKIKFLPNVRVSYDFSLSQKFALGVFAYGGRWSPILGLSIRRNF